MPMSSKKQHNQNNPWSLDELYGRFKYGPDTELETVKFLCDVALISPQPCYQCGAPTAIGTAKHRNFKNGLCQKCKNGDCGARQSLAHGTIFDGKKIGFFTILLLIYCFTFKIDCIQAGVLSGIRRLQTVETYYDCFRR